jgi:hypothetical protein
MRNQSKYFLNNREVSEEEFFGRNNLSVSNPFRGEKQVNEAVKQAIGLSTRHKAGKKMLYLDEAIEQEEKLKEVKDRLNLAEKLARKFIDDMYLKNPNVISQEEYDKIEKDDTITNVSRGEKEMMEYLQNKLNHPNTETNNCSYTMCGQRECSHCYPKKDTTTNVSTSEEEMAIEKYNQSFLDSMYFKSPFNETKKSTAINQSDFFDREQREKEIFDKLRKNLEEGVKETEGKADYSEINLNILDLMSERMQKNKYKYPPGNSKKPMDVKSLEWALFRHIKKMVQPIENDPESYKEHLAAVLCNASMILNQLELKNNQ